MDVINHSELDDSIGKRIKYIREKNNWTLKELGNQFSPSVNKVVVRQWEVDRNAPKTTNLLQLAKIGNVSVSWLMFGFDSQNFQNHVFHQSSTELEKINFVANNYLDSLSDNVKHYYLEQTEKIDSHISAYIASQRLVPESNFSLNKPKHFKGNRKILKELRQELNLNFDYYPENPYIQKTFIPLPRLEIDETKLDEANLSEDDRILSNHFFSSSEQLRLTQIENPKIFETLKNIVDDLTFLSGCHPKEAYSNSELTLAINKQQSVGERIEDNREKILAELDTLIELLKDKYQIEDN